MIDTNCEFHFITLNFSNFFSIIFMHASLIFEFWYISKCIALFCLDNKDSKRSLSIKLPYGLTINITGVMIKNRPMHALMRIDKRAFSLPTGLLLKLLFTIQYDTPLRIIINQTLYASTTIRPIIYEHFVVVFCKITLPFLLNL